MFLLAPICPSTRIAHGGKLYYMDIWADASGDAWLITLLAMACLIAAAMGMRKAFKWSVIACLGIATFSFFTELPGYLEPPIPSVVYRPYWGWLLFVSGGLLGFTSSLLRGKQSNHIGPADCGFAVQD